MHPAACILCAKRGFGAIFIITASLSDPGAVMTGKVWLYPVEMTFSGYAVLFVFYIVFYVPQAAVNSVYDITIFIPQSIVW